MNTLSAKVQLDHVARRPAPELPGSQEQGRLVVVIRDVVEEVPLASRIWSLAQSHEMGVLLFGICTSVAEEAELSRRLATISAFLRVQGAAVEFSVESGGAWLEKLKRTLTPQDELTCFMGDRSGLHVAPLSDVLSRSLNRSIRDFSPLVVSPPYGQEPLRQAGAWIASLATIAGFLLLQIRIASVLQGGAQTAVMLLLLIPEVGLLLFWNSLLG